MEETVCSIEILRNNGQLKAKVNSGGGYDEYESDDLEYLLEMVHDDVQGDLEEDYW